MYNHTDAKIWNILASTFYMHNFNSIVSLVFNRIQVEWVVVFNWLFLRVLLKDTCCVHHSDMKKKIQLINTVI